MLTSNVCNEYVFYSLIKLFEHMAYKYLSMIITKFIIYIVYVKSPRITLNMAMVVSNEIISKGTRHSI
jgi:hypothetical protein